MYLALHLQELKMGSLGLTFFLFSYSMLKADFSCVIAFG